MPKNMFSKRYTETESENTKAEISIQDNDQINIRIFHCTEINCQKTKNSFQN